MTYWDLASVIAKLVGLIGMAGVIGGSFCLYLAPSAESAVRRRVLSYILAGAVAGLLATGLFFLVQVGAINQNGLAGMWDRQMGAILAGSALGDSLGLRLLGFLAAMGMVSILRRRGNDSGSRGANGVLAALSPIVTGFLLAISFPLTGHVATLDPAAQLAIVVHVLGMFLWIGALYPLWLLCGMSSVETLQRIMRHFGRLAVFIVVLLLLSGAYLLLELLGSARALIETRYGQSLLLKLLGVTGLLTLAAMNKLILVPTLAPGNSVARLKRSIFLEMGLALAILTITAYLTTVVELPH